MIGIDPLAPFSNPQSYFFYTALLLVVYFFLRGIVRGKKSRRWLFYNWRNINSDAPPEEFAVCVAAALWPAAIFFLFGLLIFKIGKKIGAKYNPNCVECGQPFTYAVGLGGRKVKRPCQQCEGDPAERGW